MLPGLIASLAGQMALDGAPLDPELFEVLLLLNNCTDRTPALSRELQQSFPALRLHVLEIHFPPEMAHVGKARQALFDLASQRFTSLGRPTGLILTTDADSQPSGDWIAQNEAEVARGVDGVGGRILLHRHEHLALPEGVRQFLIIDIGYRRALEELRSLYAPQSHDPFPRHHQHFGGSLAVTARAYQTAGGMPLRRTNEDVALYRAVVDSGGRFRHSHAVRVYTSARMIGRAQGGLADALKWWNTKSSDASPVIVESAAAAEKRFGCLGLWSFDHPAISPPGILMVTPDTPSPLDSAEIHATLRQLRIRIAALRPLPLADRLDMARAELGIEAEEGEVAA